MDELKFYKSLGLNANPFQYTNADEEDNLPAYFIPPPYFTSVWGDPRRPSSCIIFAPRGGGKSAQRKMIEFKSSDSTVLAIQYSRFELERGQSLEQCDLEYHLKNIIRISLTAFLMIFHEKQICHLSFDSTERKHIKSLCEYYLYDLKTDEIINAANSIMTPLDKAKEFLKRNVWAINSIIDSVFDKIGIKAASRPNKEGVNIEKPSKHHLEIVINLIRSLGYESIYILIDKVDETHVTTNDSEASFKLIESIIRDLDLLQMKHICFKFFLWDKLQIFYIEYARPDRIQDFHLNWTRNELNKMIRLRLQAYSEESRLVNFHDLFNIDKEHKDLIGNIIVTFSQGSPRDMIRICRRLVVEQLRLSENPTGIGYRAFSSGLNSFCEQRSKEIIPAQVLSDLIKTHRLDFTVNYVANDVFKIKTNSARAKIKTWLNTGVVQHIDEIKIDSGRKPHHHYAVVDARVAKSIFPEVEFLDFMRDKVVICPNCSSDIFRDWNITNLQTCQKCKYQFAKE